MLTTFLAATLVGGLQTTTPIQFVVSEMSPYHGDSYVLPLSNPTDIRQARDLIRYGAQPGVAHIAVCEIRRGSDGVNRNALAAGQPLWSWHVSGFQGFSETTPEVMDGWPTYVETHLESWFPPIEDTEGNITYSETGTIGFWTYTVTQELGAGPGIPIPTVPTTAVATTPAVGKAKLTWADKSSNEDGFEIERLRLFGKTWLRDGIVGTVGANTTVFNDTTGTGTFSYKVRSFNIAGSSLWAASGSVKVR